MLHGIIVPSTQLQFALNSKFHLILPHLITSLPKYKEFYKERAREGDHVLLDNSIFELGYSLDKKELLDIAEDIHVTEVVAPEVWEDATGTNNLVEDFIEYHDGMKSNIKILAMAQGNTIDEIIESFFKWNNHIKIDSLGLPFSLDYEVNGVSDNIKSLTLRRVLNRWYLVDRINQYSKASSIRIKPTHLMGLSDAIELQRYKGDDYYWVRSNDSSTAFVHGVNGILYTDRGLPCEKIKMKLDFGGWKDLTDRQITSVEYNIAKILSWIE